MYRKPKTPSSWWWHIELALIIALCALEVSVSIWYKREVLRLRAAEQAHSQVEKSAKP